MPHVLTEKIESAVKEAIADREPATNITAPLLNMLARVLVGTAKASGAPVSELLDVAIHELTEATAHYCAAPDNE